MSFVTLLPVERQLQIDAARAGPEFAAFKRIAVTVGEPAGPFEVGPNGGVTLGTAAFKRPRLLSFFLRHALELAWLRRSQTACMGAAGLAAARVAALFIQAEMETLDADDRAALPHWVPVMASEVVPAADSLRVISAKLPGAPADAGEVTQVRLLWGLLGTAESLMETGGDIRLQRDPRSALNGYGCSHRPRPWAVTFASSTASSSSERGYLATDRERLKTTAAMLSVGKDVPVRASLAGVRRRLGRVYGLDAGTAVVLAASGTDTELMALALTHLAASEQPILNILIAPEETGRGVPMAARGVHFAVDTALGHEVAFEAAIAGFRPDTRLANIFLRMRMARFVRGTRLRRRSSRFWQAELQLATG